MYHEIKNFTVRSLILTGLIAITGFLVFKFIFSNYYLSVFPFLLIFFCVLNMIVHYLLVITSQKKSIKFETAYMISFLVKFCGYILFTVLYLRNNKENFKIFVIVLFILYVIYTTYIVKFKPSVLLFAIAITCGTV